VLIDGQDLADCQQESVRARIAMVTQDTALLHHSIRDNILYGRPEASEEALWEAARKVHADEFIPGLVDQLGRRGMDAHVGERGVRLSGGQRQRVALARAVLKDSPILILDEATSALDSEIEAAIRESLEELIAGKTVIAIAHRLSTIQRLDRIVVLDAGRVVEQGSHAELLAANGLCARLWAHQSGGFIGWEAGGVGRAFLTARLRGAFLRHSKRLPMSNDIAASLDRQHSIRRRASPAAPDQGAEDCMKTATHPRHPHDRARNYLGLFLGQMLQRPGRVAAVSPSSAALARAMTAGLGPETGAVVEFGSGTGKITEAILARGVAPERLALFETNRAFANLLLRRFPGVQVLRLDAREVEKAPLEEVGAVISGLPLLSFPTPVQRQIVKGAFRLIRPGGIFVQFTYHGWRPPVDRPVREGLRLEWEASRWILCNLPPARVYTFRRPASAGSA